MYEHIHTHKPTHLDCLHMAERISGSGQEGQERPYYCQWERERTSQNTITRRRSWTCKITVYTSLIPRHLALFDSCPSGMYYIIMTSLFDSCPSGMYYIIMTSLFDSCPSGMYYIIMTLLFDSCPSGMYYIIMTSLFDSCRITSSWHHYLTLVPQACPRGKGSSLREAKQGWGVECGQWWRGGRGRREVHGRLYQEDCRGGECVWVWVCLCVFNISPLTPACYWNQGYWHQPWQREDWWSLLLSLPTGENIFSTNEICRFVCAESGTERMWGSSPEHQALVDHWLDWEASTLKVRGGWTTGWTGRPVSWRWGVRGWEGWTGRPASWRWGGLTDHFPAS